TNLLSDWFRWPEPQTTLELLANRSVWKKENNIDLCSVRVHGFESSLDFACQLEKCIHFYRRSGNRVAARFFNLWLGHRTDSRCPNGHHHAHHHAQHF